MVLPFFLILIIISSMKWLRYQRVISLKIQVGIIRQRNKWTNMDPRIYRWDQVLRRSKHPYEEDLFEQT
jgi:hypothetical protein